jgi:hypothetical protein
MFDQHDKFLQTMPSISEKVLTSKAQSATSTLSGPQQFKSAIIICSRSLFFPVICASYRDSTFEQAPTVSYRIAPILFLK